MASPVRARLRSAWRVVATASRAARPASSARSCSRCPRAPRWRERVGGAAVAAARDHGADEANNLVALDEDAPPECGLQEPRPKPAEFERGEDRAGREHNGEEDGVDELGGNSADEALDPSQERG